MQITLTIGFKSHIRCCKINKNVYIYVQYIRMYTHILKYVRMHISVKIYVCKYAICMTDTNNCFVLVIYDYC